MARMQAAHAVHRRDHGVVEAQDVDGLGQTVRFQQVEALRPARSDAAEPARARAHVAEDDERRLACVEALADVGAIGLLTDAVQVVLPQKALDLAVALAGRKAHLEPLRLRLALGASSLHRHAVFTVASSCIIGAASCRNTARAHARR
jgi:hypothetical protein